MQFWWICTCTHYMTKIRGSLLRLLSLDNNVFITVFSVTKFHDGAGHFWHFSAADIYADTLGNRICVYEVELTQPWITVVCLFCFVEYDTVFVKDMAYYLSNRLDTAAYLPANYTHTFLVRDPRKSINSLYKMSVNKDMTGWQ